ncbi:MAG: type II secretion system protein [Gallionellaceae bacterium]|jgi:prepilin-type N-terminal cleavage/methylation domain-containing protein
MTHPGIQLTKQSGFSLIELAIVLFIVALLLGGLLPTVSGQIEQQRRAETRKQLDEIQQALLGYAISKGYLPCPAKSDSDGTEDRTAGICTDNKRIGFLPWTELGVKKSDSWNRLFTYSAPLAFTSSTAPFSLTTARDITLRTRNAAGTLVNLSNANDIPAVVVSHGPNGIFGTSENGVLVTSAAPTSNNVDDQKTNAPTPAGTGTGIAFVSRDPAGPASSTDEAFDDIVLTLSPNILFNRMVTAGKLP